MMNLPTVPDVATSRGTLGKPPETPAPADQDPVDPPETTLDQQDPPEVDE